MFEDKLQMQRFELKYRVSQTAALEIRDFLGSYLEPDEYSAGKPNNSYSNHSLYLDSDGLDLFWDVLNSNKNRYKLRIRYYDDNPDAPAFLEIKRRVNDAILKQRCPARREALPELLSGQLPQPEQLFSTKPAHLAAALQFSRLMQDLRAAPKMHVCYLREAWVKPTDNSVRVTLDRDICCAPHFDPSITTQIENYIMPFEPNVILELKFTGKFPLWFRELVEIFEVMQCGAAKYADGVALVGEERLNPAHFPLECSDLVERYLSRRQLPDRPRPQNDSSPNPSFS